MPTWSDVARECRDAARALREAGYWRGALNRAYFAFFSEIARVLVLANVTMPLDWEGPKHGALGDLIANNLSNWFSAPHIGRLLQVRSLLYKLRIIADYSPSQAVEKRDADTAIGYLLQAMEILEKAQ